MRKLAVPVVCAASALALSACGSTKHATAPPTHPLTPRVTALRDSQTLLARIAIPTGAKPAPKLDAGLLASSTGGLSVGASRVWRVQLPYRTVLRFFKHQHPRGAVSQSGM